MFNKLKQIKDLRDQAKKMQSALGAHTLEGSGDWGKVKISMDGNMKVQKIHIDPSLSGNLSKIESALIEAFNEAVKKVQKVMMDEMKSSGKLDEFLKK